jgi:hypothetical protein
MRKNYSIGLFVFLLLFLFSLQSRAQKGIFSDLIPDNTKLEAEASMTLVKVNNKGVSYVDTKDQPKVSGDVAVLISFAFLEEMSTLHKVKLDRKNSPFLETASIDSSGTFRDRFPMAVKKEKGYPYLTTGLEFVGKSTRETQGSNSQDINLSYLVIPVTMNYHFPINAISSLHFGAGPYFGYAVSGNFNFQGQKTPVHFGSDPNVDDIKRTDYGVLINGGILLTRHYNITLQYDFGLRNISATPPDPNSHLGGFSLHVAYRF